MESTPSLQRLSENRIIKTKKELENIPVIAGADFGHTTPIFTFPIGGNAKLVAKNEKIELDLK